MAFKNEREREETFEHEEAVEFEVGTEGEFETDVEAEPEIQRRDEAQKQDEAEVDIVEPQVVENVVERLLNDRPSKDEYYLGIAKAVSKRSTCTRKRFGAIIVKDDVIVSTGYTGAARGVINCMEVGCLKDEVDAPEYTGYEYCISVHAEENAIINAARHGASVLGGTLYIYGEFAGKKYGAHQGIGKLTEAKPCDRCRRAIINAGITMVVIQKADGSIEKITTQKWVEEDSRKYVRLLEEARAKKSFKKF